MSKSQKYWKKRIQQQEHNTDKINENYLNGIDKHLQRYKNDLKKEIESFYSRYATDYKMTMADARKLLTDDEVKEFKNSTLARYRELVLDPNTPPQLIDALSYRHRISRKDALIAEIERLTVELYGGKDGIQESVTDCLGKVYKKASIDIAKGFQLAGKDARPILNDDVVKQKLNANWSGKTFSQAVWGHEKEYMKKIEKTLNHGFMQGHNVNKMINALEEVTNVPRYRVKALIYTESTYFANLANMDQMKAVDAKQYEIMAVRDNKTSEKCKHEDGKVYDIDKFEPGNTAPPFHVHCRSSIIPSLTEEEEKLFEEPEEEDPHVIKKKLEKEYDKTKLEAIAIKKRLKEIEMLGDNPNITEAEEDKLINEMNSLWSMEKRIKKRLNELKKYLAELTSLEKNTPVDSAAVIERRQFLKNATPNDIIELGKSIEEKHKISEVIGKPEKIKAIFEQYRPMGGKVNKEDWSTYSDKKVKAMFEDALSYYPTEWADVPRKHHKQIKCTKAGRGFFSSEGALNAAGDRYDIRVKNYRDCVTFACNTGTYARKTTPFHEVGHMMEWDCPDLVRLEKEYIAMRAQGEDLVRLKDLFPGYDYDDDELCLKDDFLSPYMGKPYEDAAEIFTMGIEGLFKKSGYIKGGGDYKTRYITDDEEFMHFIIGLLTKV
ncbi:phage putative head morphogenesis protein, SPP1 gp7 family [Granulicatella balaenopterae]|uniref:Phage putative head morphogenesis protein, SPP1 gp7 family n=1 Tax=Granulicatella balaenopterae TaxID=137733 RepID=A0A1H9IMN7_9LACT|nr:minor capsid protein [Granulicatella balaenopterae]SEQ75779.1 phage putative head morphogenesis protein, SPP1 gp7 family [Granulicatella balaenopterae]